MGTDFAAVARLLANGPRSAMIDRLMDGTPASAGELARLAGVRASTATDHLAQLEAGGLVTAVRDGRSKYFTIAGRDVATALERFSLICPPRPVRSLKQSREASAIAHFRTCYDHLAGSVAVAVFDELARRRWIVRGADDARLSRRGEAALTAAGVDVERARSARRTFVRTCLDWTERRPHLAGALGAELAGLFLTRGWARRRPSGRGLDLTASGAAALKAHFGVDAERA